jgi:16S rRNA (cytidine1402-2'-O)-methyltransferase
MGVLVQVFEGPSSILTALMLSGMDGQRIAFHGYVDRDHVKRKEQIARLEKRAKSEQSTQLFMEAPYRNQQLLEMMVEQLHDETWLCAAWDLTMPTQGIVSQPVKLWKKCPLPNLDKRNTIFLIG